MRKFIIFCFVFLSSISSIGFAQTNCGENFVNYNGTCKPLRTTSNKPAPFVPTAVTNREGIVLYPNVMPAKCATAQADSDCITTYSYTDTSLPATISASFSKLSPIAGQESSVLTWTTGNAVTLSLYCSGVASIYNSTVALQNNVTGITFSSQTAGAHTCTFTAINPFGTSSSATFTVNFVDPLPRPTITFTRAPRPLVAGSNHSAVWNTTNATSVSGVCTSTGTGYTYTGPLALSGNNTSMTSSAWVGYPTRCVWTAFGPGGSTSVVDEFSTVAPLVPAPTISVSRTNGLPMIYPGTTGSVWSTTNATSLTLACTSPNGGYSLGLTSMPLNGVTNGPTLASWVGKTSTCTWTATGPGGSATSTETLSAVSAPLIPVYLVQYDLRFLLTSDASEIAWHVNNWRAVNHGVAFYAFASPSAIPGLTAVHKYLNTSNSSYFYTSNGAEMASLPSSYSYRGVAWYGQYNNSANGVVPLNRFRWYDPGLTMHYFTRSSSGGSYNVPEYSGLYVWP